MAEQESLRSKIIIAALQTLVFGAALAVFAYWLNVRLETVKGQIAGDNERTKASLQGAAPVLLARRSAYEEIQEAVRQANRDLEACYFRSGEPYTSNVQETMLRKLDDAMGHGSGGSGGSFSQDEDALGSLRRLFSLRKKYEYVSSANVNGSLDLFLEIVETDLLKHQQKANMNKAFDKAARQNLRKAFATLDKVLSDALRVDDLPLK